MSDAPQGPGWWQASDGKWYPPSASPAYAPPPYGLPTASTPGKVTAALVLAILSFFACPVILAIVALVVANSASQEIAASGGRLEGESTLKTARIVAWVNIALFGVVAAFALISIVAVTILGSNAEQKFEDLGGTIEMLRVWLPF